MPLITWISVDSDPRPKKVIDACIRYSNIKYPHRHTEVHLQHYNQLSIVFWPALPSRVVCCGVQVRSSSRQDPHGPVPTGWSVSRSLRRTSWNLVLGYRWDCIGLLVRLRDYGYSSFPRLVEVLTNLVLQYVRIQ